MGIPAHVASGPGAVQQYFFVTLDPSGGARPLRQDSLASGRSAGSAPRPWTSPSTFSDPRSPSVGDGSQALVRAATAPPARGRLPPPSCPEVCCCALGGTLSGTLGSTLGGTLGGTLGRALGCGRPPGRRCKDCSEAGTCDASLAANVDSQLGDVGLFPHGLMLSLASSRKKKVTALPAPCVAVPQHWEVAPRT